MKPQSVSLFHRIHTGPYLLRCFLAVLLLTCLVYAFWRVSGNRRMARFSTQRGQAEFLQDRERAR